MMAAEDSCLFAFNALLQPVAIMLQQILQGLAEPQLPTATPFHPGLQVEFDDVPQLSSAAHKRRREWWRQTKQLQHGSLVALWWDGDHHCNSSSSGVGALPNLMFATVCDRQDNLLASPAEPRRRPQLGLR